MGKKKGAKSGAGKMVVRRDVARKYHEFLGIKIELGSGLSAYRMLACDNPEALDAATLAAVLSGAVDFDRSAGTVLIAYIEEDEDAEAPAFDSFRGGVRTKVDGKDASKIIAACESHGCTDMLVEAFVFLFIEENEDDFDLDTGVDAFPEPEKDDNDRDLPGTAPDGYPSNDSESDGSESNDSDGGDEEDL